MLETFRYPLRSRLLCLPAQYSITYLTQSGLSATDVQRSIIRNHHLSDYLVEEGHYVSQVNTQEIRLNGVQANNCQQSSI